MDDQKGQSVATDIVPTPSAIDTPHLPTEILTLILGHVLENAYPDFLRKTPAQGEGTSEHGPAYLIRWNYCYSPAEHELFRHYTPRYRFDCSSKRDGPRYQDGATALTCVAKRLAAVSTTWLDIVYNLYDDKLKDIAFTEKSLYEYDREWAWYRNDKQALLRGFWFEWKILEGCRASEFLDMHGTISTKTAYTFPQRYSPGSSLTSSEAYLDFLETLPIPDAEELKSRETTVE
jgi:hypothetical protein